LSRALQGKRGVRGDFISLMTQIIEHHIVNLCKIPLDPPLIKGDFSGEDILLNNQFHELVKMLAKTNLNYKLIRLRKKLQRQGAESLRNEAYF
jgi:hypothetical protein